MKKRDILPDPSELEAVMKILFLVAALFILQAGETFTQEGGKMGPEKEPYLVVLGIAQDGGVPQAGTKAHAGWDDPAARRLVACLAIVDPETSERWLIDATPDFKEQLHRLDKVFPVKGRPGLDGIFITHAHMGHYTGLMHLGLESMGAKEVSVHAMPRMRAYLSRNGPWDQLVRYKNIVLEPLEDGAPVRLNERLTITPFLVPHRQEYSEVVGFLIKGPKRSVLFIPDIDKWEDWDRQGVRIESMLAKVDVAYLDGTFYGSGEIPGRDMSSFPHPFITHSMERFQSLPKLQRAKVRFIHLNHTNSALHAGSEARVNIEKKGFRVAEEMERVIL
jgi:pyrroloquinoline quinone biosynthesis protein B